MWGQLAALQQFYEHRWGDAGGCCLWDLGLPLPGRPGLPPAARCAGALLIACRSWLRPGSRASWSCANVPLLLCALGCHVCRLAAVRAAGEPEPSPAYLQAGGAEAAEAAEQRDQQDGGRQQGQQPPAAGSPAGSPPGEQRAQPAQQAQRDWHAQHAAALASLDASLAQLWEAAPAGTLLVVITGQGDTGYCRWGSGASMAGVGRRRLLPGACQTRACVYVCGWGAGRGGLGGGARIVLGQPA